MIMSYQQLEKSIMLEMRSHNIDFYRCLSLVMQTLLMVFGTSKQRNFLTYSKPLSAILSAANAVCPSCAALAAPSAYIFLISPNLNLGEVIL